MNKQDLANAFDLLEPTQEIKYNVKNAINTKPTERKPFIKRSASAILSIVLASILVVTAAAFSVTLFRAIYGDKAEALTPYGITIGTSARNDDVVLTLHESVADDYASAYIFSVRGLTDAGKAIVVNNTLGLSGSQTTFKQLNINQEGVPPEITNSKIYRVSQQNASGEFDNLNIGLRCDGMEYNVADNASYVIIPIESLREENCEYYALYAITPEKHQLTLTFDDLELPLPEATTHIPGVEIQIEGYIQDYFLTEGGMITILSDYPASAVLTPLGLYVNDKHAGSTPMMYRNAVLVFSDGSEKELSEIANDKAGVVSWSTSYFPTYYQGAVYLFNEIMDVSTVKSLLFYGEIEFPFDDRTPFIRSSGRLLDPNNPQLIWWKTKNQILDNINETFPGLQFVRETGYSGSNFEFSYSYEIVDNGSVNNNNCKFNIIFSELSGGTLEEEARARVEIMNVHKHGYENDLTFTVTNTGVCNGTDVLIVACGEYQPGLYKRCIFALVEGKLLTIEYNGPTGQPNDYAFDALLDLITFD